MRHLFIINPAAGQKKAIGMVPEIERIMGYKCDEYSIEYTKGPGHATEIARRYVERDDFRVYSIGGDGTLSEVLNGLVGSNSSLSVIPAGSGNDFFRSISEKKTNNILQRTIDGSERPIDIGRVNNKYFLNISSIGFDAEVANSANTLKEKTFLSGSAAYLASVFITILKNRSYDVDITIDGKHLHENILLAAIANGRFYGGGILPAPEATIDDGLFDICTVSALSKSKIIWLLPKYIRGKHTDMKEVKFYKGREIAFHCNHSMLLNIDGEVESVFKVEFQIIPKALKFIFPVPYLSRKKIRSNV